MFQYLVTVEVLCSLLKLFLNVGQLRVNIFNLGSKKQVELYNQGIVEINDIPHDFDMTTKQAQAVENYKSRVTYIDNEAIDAFVSSLSFPIYHLDFETFQQAIPEWKGISPFMQIPFQYSLHNTYII